MNPEITALWDKINEVEKKLSDFYDELHIQNASNIDYIAMETGIDLDQDAEVSND